MKEIIVGMLVVLSLAVLAKPIGGVAIGLLLIIGTVIQMKRDDKKLAEDIKKIRAQYSGKLGE